MTGGDPCWIRPRLISQLLIKISNSLGALLVNMIGSNDQDCTQCHHCLDINYYCY